MNIPMVRTIKLNSQEFDDLVKILDQYKWSENPYIIELSPELNHRLIIEVFEKYFKSHNLSPDLPYPTIFLINPKVANLTSDYFRIIESTNQFPKFFIRKQKTANIKEQSLAQSLSLTHQNTRGINQKVLKEKISLYAKSHKEIYQLATENEFYENLINHYIIK
jgi:hypothetical protein